MTSQQNLDDLFARAASASELSNGIRPGKEGGTPLCYAKRCRFTLPLSTEPGGEWPHAQEWLSWKFVVPNNARYHAGSQPILDSRPLEFPVLRQCVLAPSFALCSEMKIFLEEVARR